MPKLCQCLMSDFQVVINNVAKNTYLKIGRFDKTWLRRCLIQYSETGSLVLDDCREGILGRI